MNFFSSTVFLESLAETRFKGSRTEIRDFLVEGQRFRLLVVNGKPITRWPWLDFFEPLQDEPPAPGGMRRLGYLPTVASGHFTVHGEKPDLVVPGTQASPLIDFTALPTRDALVAHIRSRRSNLLTDSAKRERKLAAEHGEVTYCYDDDSPDVMELGASWKAAQFMHSFGINWFFTENLPLFHALARKDALVRSSLRAGGKLVSTIWSGFLSGRLYYWMATYDPALSAFSPGRLLVEKLIFDSQARGHREFDFLIGDEPYKWHYASHTRLVAPLGTPPLRLRVEKEAKKQLKKALEKYPRLMETAKDVKKRFRL